MSFHALIPVAALLISAAFGAVSMTWDSGDPKQRGTRTLGALFLCTGTLALLDVMTFLENDPERVRSWFRWMHLPALLLGPLTISMLAQMLPQTSHRLRHLIRAGFLVSVLVGIAVGLLPSTVIDVVPTAWGSWSPRFGLAGVLVVPIGTVLPLLAAWEASRAEIDGPSADLDASRARAVMVCVGISLLAAVSTEYVMPLLEISAPRLGAFAIACASALMWFRVLHLSDALAATPEGMARSMLAELHDGIVLVQLDGTILSSNIRFSEMAGRRRIELIGTSLENRVGPSLEEIFAGLEDRETILHREDGETLPVSLSSSPARDRDGHAIGAVVVFRDLREIDALRRRLLASGRMAAIGELAAGIAHELNNPIAFVRSDLHLLADRLEELETWIAARPRSGRAEVDLDRMRQRIEVGLEGIERVAEVVGDVRGFAHVGGAGQGGIDPAVLVEGAMRLARLQRGSEVELRVADCDSSDWIDSGQELKQVLLSLLLILVECTEKGGEIVAALETEGGALRITLSADPLDEDANAVVRRLESLTIGVDHRVSHEEFRMAIAAELIEQLNASLSVAETGSRSVSVALHLPLSAWACA